MVDLAISILSVSIFNVDLPDNEPSSERILFFIRRITPLPDFTTINSVYYHAHYPWQKWPNTRDNAKLAKMERLDG